MGWDRVRELHVRNVHIEVSNVNDSRWRIRTSDAEVVHFPLINPSYERVGMLYKRV